MKKIVLIICLFLSLKTFGQNHNLTSQYFQVMPFYAPGLTGANDYLDIRTGFRRQWVDIQGAPLSYFIGGSGVIDIGSQNPYKYNSVRVGNNSPYKRKTTKVGLGGYIFNEKLGALNQIGSMFSAAAHISITNSIYLSLGITSGFHNAKVNVSNLQVLNPDNDEIYQDYLENGANGNYFKLNSGISAYSETFYLSYSFLNLTNTQISGNQNLFNGPSDILHTIVGGYRLSAGPKFEIIPNTYVRFSESTPVLLDIGTRFRYNQSLYFGMSYRNDQTTIGMLGLTLGNMYSFGYSIERKKLGFDGISALSHEVVIGIQFFNARKYIPLW